MSVNGLYGNGPILIPSNKFLDSVRKYANDRQREQIESSVYSINYKLNIVRHNAGLIHNLQAEDFEKHREGKFKAEELPRIISYLTRCEFRVRNFDDYSLFLMFFLEAITTASFSLLDACASLLNEIYDLEIVEDKISYLEVCNRLKESFGADDLLVQTLEKYLTDNVKSVSWLKPLQAIKDAIKLRRVTDICIHNKTTPLINVPSTHTLLLRSTFFNPNRQDVAIQVFMEECFIGLEGMVIELYEQLRSNLEKDMDIPLYGSTQQRDDHEMALDIVATKGQQFDPTIHSHASNHHTSFTRLNHNSITDIRDLLITAGINDDHKIQVLLGGIDPLYISSIPTGSNLKARIQTILDDMNRAEKLENGEVPLEIFLANAISFIKPQSQAKELQTYLDQLHNK
jgi:Effector-associated domain 5/Cthe_2314-like HEPN